MASKLSLEFLSWLLEQRNNDISGFVMLSGERVPEKFSKIIWPILDELRVDGVIKGLRKYGQMDKQQCDFSLTPTALDVMHQSISAHGTTHINFYGDIAHSQIATGNHNSFGAQSNVKTVNHLDYSNLYEKKTIGSIFRFVLFDVIALVANIATIIATYLSLKSENKNVIVAAIQYDWRIYLIFFMIFVFVIMVQITWYLWLNKRWFNLIRQGKTIYKVKSKKCPCCGAKMDYIYRNNAGCFSCSENPRDHSFDVDHTKL
ncbi:hypothetical protein [Desulfitobacterium hafniense]|nr:hypothetical protein [Desulfitobacterium hafniense]KTE91836.1 hypothetical protein AT727_20380 [Desulfitobacterium hafniense]